MPNDFFPDEVNVESISRYTRLEAGKTKLRMLGKPIFFQETWNAGADGKRVPSRFRLSETVPAEKVGPDGLRTSMAVKVYNYNDGAIQIWQVGQKSILKAIKEYSQNEAYGAPTGYDLVIAKTGQAMQTRYGVIANPPAELPAAVKALDESTPVDLDRMFTNGDPFKTEADIAAS